MEDVRVHQETRGHFLSIGVLLLVASERCCLRALELRRQKAELLDTPHFGDKRFSTTLGTTVFHLRRERKGVFPAGEPALESKRVHEWRVGLLRDLGEARPQHRREEVAQHLLAVVANGRDGGSWQLDDNLHRRAGRFLVARDRHERLAVVGQRHDDAWPRIGTRDCGEVFLDQRFDGVDVDVAHHDDCFQVWPVPVVIKPLKQGWSCRENRPVGADHVASRVLGVLVHDRRHLASHAPERALSAAPLFDDDAALVRDFGGIEK
jgi:hypothetical protein